MEIERDCQWQHAWSYKMNERPEPNFPRSETGWWGCSLTAWGEWHIVATRESDDDGYRNKKETQYLWRRLIKFTRNRV